jgi:uncharacterized membrane protein
VDLILCVIFVTNCELLKLAGDVIRGTAVDIPVRVHPIAYGVRAGYFGVVLTMERFIKTMPTLYSFMVAFPTDLTHGLVVVVASLALLLGCSTATAIVAADTAATIATATATEVTSTSERRVCR